MPSFNRITIATAGSGKTTGIAVGACNHTAGRSALITYTRNGTAELREKVLDHNGFVPAGMEVGTWFTFLLRHFVRPYQRALYSDAPVRRLAFIEGRSAKYEKKTDITCFYFNTPEEIYSDKISQFACEVIAATGGLPIQRAEQIFDKLFIDEIQDIAGYDLDLIEHLLSSEIDVVMVGDVRQGTYKTNNSGRNTQYGGARIIDKFEEWERTGKAEIDYELVSKRCVQPICDFADRLYPELPRATSANRRLTGHDGVFAVRASDTEAYMSRYKPQTLRLSRATRDVPGCPINFGAAKGKTFERTLIFPHKNLLHVLRTGDVNRLGNAPSTIAKVYVAVTRARQSVGFVIPDNMTPSDIRLFDPLR